ncbi:Hydrogen peroxide-inducible activator [Caballeronia sordidicola]|jgi:DNA-binding transcriptional LysR family regulator|uniref:Hydrogen peroxide-inducible activator n=1 Tax=Caballeronia sordidicola TaxID=196367 RepID=A0A226WMQ5_CABSO|nr:LysR family transcriptional regulator [Caballeronia sordidicola]OXC72100.1 Hydrogen peroxide-inducible activator [Caballeronia sordidicola]
MFIRQLEYLVTLAREKHFARAAEACHVSQPALSSAIRTLEAEVGLVMVERTRCVCLLLVIALLFNNVVRGRRWPDLWF